MFWIRDVHPEPRSWFFIITDPASRVPDPTTPTKEEEVNKKICFPAFFVARNLINFKISSFLILYSKKICANSLRTFIIYKKKSLSSQKYRFENRDPRSMIRKNLFRILGSKRHRIPDPDPQHCWARNLKLILYTWLGPHWFRSSPCMRGGCRPAAAGTGSRACTGSARLQ